MLLSLSCVDTDVLLGLNVKFGLSEDISLKLAIHFWFFCSFQGLTVFEFENHVGVPSGLSLTWTQYLVLV